jgi:hypothetical protein
VKYRSICCSRERGVREHQTLQLFILITLPTHERKRQCHVILLTATGCIDLAAVHMPNKISRSWHPRDFSWINKSARSKTLSRTDGDETTNISRHVQEYIQRTKRERKDRQTEEHGLLALSTSTLRIIDSSISRLPLASDSARISVEVYARGDPARTDPHQMSSVTAGGAASP